LAEQFIIPGTRTGWASVGGVWSADAGFIGRLRRLVLPRKSSEIMVGGRQVHTLIGHTAHVRSVDFSPNGNRVASGSYDRLVKIWDTKTGALVSSIVGVR